MLTRKKMIASFLALTLFAGFTGYGVRAETEEDADSNGSVKAHIEETLNLANNTNQEWTYSANANAWVLSVVSAVAYPELPDQQGVSVCVPGAYVAGIDTNGDGNANITAKNASGSVKGALVIDYDAQITSTNGQTDTAATAPVIIMAFQQKGNINISKTH